MNNMKDTFKNITSDNILSLLKVAQLAGAVEYTDCTSAEG